MSSASVITSEMRRLIGVETPAYSLVIEKGAVQRFLDATGETNPLFFDDEFASRTGFGSTITPPTFFCPDALLAAEIAGLKRFPNPLGYWIDGGSEWQLFEPVRVADILSISTKIADVYERRSSSGDPLLFTIIEAVCRNQHGRVVGVARGTGIGHEKPSRDRSPGTALALTSLGEAQSTDSAIPRLVKGPVTLKTLVKYAGATGDYAEIHYDEAAAKAWGLPGPIVTGPLKSAYVAQMLTNWIAPDGWIRKLACQYRGIDIPGCVLTCRGTVRERLTERGETRSECDVWVENERGEVTTKGMAIVAVPSQAASDRHGLEE